MALINYNITNDGGTTVTSLNFVFVTPPQVLVHANFSNIKLGAPADFSGTNYTVTGLVLLPGQSKTFSVDYTYLTGGPGVYNGSVDVTGLSDYGTDTEVVLTEITLTNSVAADFSGTPLVGYAPLTVNFTDQSLNSPLSWAWDFQNNGSTDSIIQNPSFTYATPGTYSVKLTVTNAFGSDNEIKTNYITVNYPPIPVANFSATPLTGYAPLSVTFTDLSTDTPTSWAWDFTNDGITDSTLQNPTHLYNTPGTYAVKLTVGNSYGTDNETKIDYITVNSPPPPTRILNIIPPYLTFNPLPVGPVVPWGDLPTPLVPIYPVSLTNSGNAPLTISYPEYDPTLAAGAGIGIGYTSPWLYPILKIYDNYYAPYGQLSTVVKGMALVPPIIINPGETVNIDIFWYATEQVPPMIIDISFVTNADNNDFAAWSFLPVGINMSGSISGTVMTLVYNTELSPTTEIELPLYGTVNVVINWGDGNTETVTSEGMKSHTYLTEGIYLVSISGTLTHFGSPTYGTAAVNSTSLISVISFGTLGLTSLANAFYDCHNLVSVPPLLPSGITDLSYTFARCFVFNSFINSWDVSSVTTLEGTFMEAEVFNQPLNSWNTSNVTNMAYTFLVALAFNQPLNNWNTSNVTTLESTFDSAEAFNQNINNWNTSNVTNMLTTFAGARSFNQPLNNWNVSNVTDMTAMFQCVGASGVFNQNISNWCVNLISTEPNNFSLGVPLDTNTSFKPVWGTCPGV